jgi:hypothetical protein
MHLWLDPNFWSRHFVEVFAAQLNAFVDAVERRVLPGFDSIDREAREAAQREYERLGRMPANDSFDMADAAEQAVDAGIALYQALWGVRQALLNLSAAALYHLFEQQLLLFHRRQVLHPSNQNDMSQVSFEALKLALAAVGVHVNSLPSWPIIEELRLLANAVKHGEGKSAAKLRGVRPQFFTDPSIASTLPTIGLPKSINMPLAGQDIYVTRADLARYSRALTNFWIDLAAAITPHADQAQAAQQLDGADPPISKTDA